MEAKEVIERFCKLQRLAAEQVGFVYAADCFCQQSGFWGAQGYGGTFDTGYRNDGKALEFIEQAVREKIERETANAAVHARAEPVGRGPSRGTACWASLDQPSELPHQSREDMRDDPSFCFLHHGHQVVVGQRHDVSALVPGRIDAALLKQPRILK